jgi:hypothetical protein
VIRFLRAGVVACASAVLVAGSSRSLDAQAVDSQLPPITPSSVARSFETRAELEAQARSAEEQKRTSEAWLLRQRLSKGDFQEGDRILLVFQRIAARPDTMMVRAGRVLSFPQMGEVSLEGVLRSELSQKLIEHLKRYLKEPTLVATPLVRLAVLGTVNRPGYYYVSADVILSDVIMLAGGPAGNADLKNVQIKRAGDVIWGPEETQTALAEGLSLDRLHLRAGDEIDVAERRQKTSWLTMVSAVSGIVGLAITVLQLSR